VAVNPSAMFDVQIKRLHEYKRNSQSPPHFALYRRLLQNPEIDMPPRVSFSPPGGAGYDLASASSRRSSVAAKINSDTRINDRLKVVFLPNYGFSGPTHRAWRRSLRADLHRGQGSVRTGNMKLALNGALTIGTLDGANVEILEEVGPENIFIFGSRLKSHRPGEKSYKPQDIYNANEELRAVVDWVGSNYFTPDEPGCLNMLRDNLIHSDPSWFWLTSRLTAMPTRRWTQPSRIGRTGRKWRF